MVGSLDFSLLLLKACEKWKAHLKTQVYNMALKETKVQYINTNINVKYTRALGWSVKLVETILMQLESSVQIFKIL